MMASAIESVSDFLMADLNWNNFKIEFMLEVHLERETGAKSTADVGSQGNDNLAKGAVGYWLLLCLENLMTIIMIQKCFL